MARNLSLGNSGEDVRNLQGLLNFHLASPCWKPIDADSVFGPQTRARVIDFQRVNELTTDGIVGPRTLALLLDVRDVRFCASLAPADAPPRNVASGGSPRPARTNVASPFLLADSPDNGPSPAAPPPLQPRTLGQRTISLQAGSQLDVNPFTYQPLVLTGQFNWIFRRDGLSDFTISAGGQFSLNQTPGPNGSWTGQGFVQMGPTGLLKLGKFDLLNPFVTLMLQQNQGQPLQLGTGIGDQVAYTLWNKPNPDPNNKDNDLDNLSLFINAQLVTNLALSGPDAGRSSAPSLQILGGVQWTFDWTPKSH
jgi:hypothetical protein